jgi:hypothetical protein
MSSVQFYDCNMAGNPMKQCDVSGTKTSAGMFSITVAGNK